MASAEYITQVRRLLHDANASYWQDAELLDDINQARNRIALEQGCVRQLITPYNLSANQEVYPFNGIVSNVAIASAGSGFTSAPTLTFSTPPNNGTTASATAAITSGTISSVTITGNGTNYTAAPTITVTGGGGTTATLTASITQNIYDVVNVTVNWGNSWISLAYTYFTEFQAKARYYRNITGQPALFSVYNQNLYIFQIPSSTFPAELDCLVTPNALVDDTTFEQINYPYTDLVQYYAAYLAKYKQQKYEDAEKFLMLYEKLAQRGKAAAYQRRIRNPYG